MMLVYRILVKGYYDVEKDVLAANLDEAIGIFKENWPKAYADGIDKIEVVARIDNQKKKQGGI